MTWVDLSSAFGYGTKLTSANMQQLRDNIAAAFAKDSGAPVLADDYIVLAMMGANSVDSDQYIDGSIDHEHYADDSIGADKFQRGASHLPLLMYEEDTELTTVNTSFYTFLTTRIYIPTNANTIRGYFRIQIDNPGQTVTARLSVGGQTGDATHTGDTSYTWVTIGSIDVSGLGGSLVTVLIQVKGTAGATAGIQGFVFYWD